MQIKRWRQHYNQVRPHSALGYRLPAPRARMTGKVDPAFFLVPAQAFVGQFLATFKEFPPRQKAASFSIDQVMEKLAISGGSK